MLMPRLWVMSSPPSYGCPVINSHSRPGKSKIKKYIYRNLMKGTQHMFHKFPINSLTGPLPRRKIFFLSLSFHFHYCPSTFRSCRALHPPPQFSCLWSNVSLTRAGSSISLIKHAGPFVTAALLARGSAEDVSLAESEDSSQSSILLPTHQSCLQPWLRLRKTHI